MFAFDWHEDTGEKDISWCIMARYLSCVLFVPAYGGRLAAGLHIEPCKYPLPSASVGVTPAIRLQEHINSALCMLGTAIEMIIKPFFLLQDMVIAPTRAVTHVNLGG